MAASEIILLEPDLDDASVREREERLNENIQNIAVIGGGIMGLMSAYQLSRAGHCVRIYDPCGFVADNASAVAGGMLAPYSEIEHMPMAFVRAGLDGIAMWRDIVADLPRAVDFTAAGSLFVAHREDAYMVERFASHLPAGASRRVDVAGLEPQLAGRFGSGLLIEGEAHLHPLQAMEALVEALRIGGVGMIAEAVEPLELADQFDYVVDCRGYGARGDDVDLRGVKGELAVVENAEFALSRAVRLMHPRYPLYIVPRPDNVFMIGATVVEGAEDARVSVRSAMELLSGLYSLHPSFGEAKILDIVAGVRPSYIDNLPRISVQGNVVACNGLFRHGYLLSPVMARDVCEIVAGRGGESIFVDRALKEKVA